MKTNTDNQKTGEKESFFVIINKIIFKPKEFFAVFKKDKYESLSFYFAAIFFLLFVFNVVFNATHQSSYAGNERIILAAVTLGLIGVFAYYYIFPNLAYFIILVLDGKGEKEDTTEAYTFVAAIAMLAYTPINIIYGVIDLPTIINLLFKLGLIAARLLIYLWAAITIARAFSSINKISMAKVFASLVVAFIVATLIILVFGVPLTMQILSAGVNN